MRSFPPPSPLAPHCRRRVQPHELPQLRRGAWEALAVPAIGGGLLEPRHQFAVIDRIGADRRNGQPCGLGVGFDFVYEVFHAATFGKLPEIVNGISPDCKEAVGLRQSAP